MRDIYENFDIIPQNKKVVIWGMHQDSDKIFCETLNRRIPVAFFVDVTGDFHGMEKKKLFGKPLLTKEELLTRINVKDIFILADRESTTAEDLKWMEEYVKDSYYVCSASDLDPAIRNSSGIYIYGAGHSGKRTYKLLKKNGIKINAFVDSDVSKWGEYLEDAYIYGPEVLDKSDIVIISTRYYHEIKEKLLEMGIPQNKIYVDIRNSAEFPEEPIQYKDRLRLWFEYTNCAVIRAINWIQFINNIISDYYEKKSVILYGVNEFTRQFISLFNLVDVNVLYCVDFAQNIENMQLNTEVECRDIFDLATEDMSDKIVYVIKVEENNNEVQDTDYTILEKIGLSFFSEIRLFELAPSGAIRNSKTKDCLGIKNDHLLEYVYLYKKSSLKYPGYVVLGDEKSANKRIMILGGSTSDVGFYEGFIKSWPEFLEDKLNDTVIFCGAIAGYNSKQELLKLLRDGKMLHADLVISYSGVNDMAQEHTEGYPYARKILKDKSFEDTVWGLKTDTSMAEEWIESENMMKIIANQYGADFVGIFQPIIINKKQQSMTFNEKIIYKWSNQVCYYVPDEYKDFQNNVREKIKKISYIYDMTELFQYDKREIYRDGCHLSEEGNRTLADAVYEIIKRRMQF